MIQDSDFPQDLLIKVSQDSLNFFSYVFLLGFSSFFISSPIAMCIHIGRCIPYVHSSTYVHGRFLFTFTFTIFMHFLSILLLIFMAN